MCRTFGTTSECTRTQPRNTLYIVGARSSLLEKGVKHEEKVTEHNLAGAGFRPERSARTGYKQMLYYKDGNMSVRKAHVAGLVEAEAGVSKCSIISMQHRGNNHPSPFMAMTKGEDEGLLH